MRNGLFAALVLSPAVAAAEPVTILALGDSLTAGYGLPQEDGLVPQLQAWLTQAGEDAVVVNAGVSGDTTAGGLSRLDWSLTPDIDAVIVTLGGNDMLRGIDPAVSRANLDAILSTLEDRGLPALLIGLEGPTNYGPDYKDAFDAMFPDLAAKYGALLIPSFFAPLQKDSRDPADLRAWFQDDGIHPNADGVRKIVAGIGPQVQALIDRAE